MPWSNGFNLGSNSLVSFACSGHVHPNGGIEPFWFWHRALERASQFGLKQGAWITRLQMLQFCVGIPFAAAVLPKIFAALLEMAGSFLLLRFSNLVKKTSLHRAVFLLGSVCFKPKDLSENFSVS